MKKLTEEERQDILDVSTQEAASMLYMAFVMCELKTHIYLICDFGSKRFKLTFEPVVIECDQDEEHKPDECAKVMGRCIVCDHYYQNK